ncbi:MAG: BON domain-containing protein [Sedimenticola sp.]|uniref:BON domain-containing protein n=1 Tax=Sedimenticola thiotaurini TaxID=1543721 RepID=A0A558D0E9_9GAMM|nr:BON domain-containing protein [Sedimenticola sp.]TVT54494.1 MAG: BON domain-containing protein [Sedimenticola thiotaurini]MCW8881811.1 BON domain-containing protein [Sedimenticola sp.]MCW8947827.1 BON domain-containing protein [Sedimenticola sp.]MCW8950628.1 BON domain-containing protein [Sedimenticola sp.]
MNRTATLLLGLIGFILIFSLAVYNGIDKVENDLSTRGRAALDEHNLQWVELKIDGRNLLLSGLAPSEKAVSDALALAENLPGVDRVYDEFSFHEKAVKTEKPSSGSAWSSSIKAQ